MKQIAEFRALLEPTWALGLSSDAFARLDRGSSNNVHRVPSNDSAHSSDTDDDPTLQAWGSETADIVHDSDLPLDRTSPDSTDLLTPFLARQNTTDNLADALEKTSSSLRLAVTYLYKIPLRLPVAMARLKDLPAENDDLMKHYQVLDRNHVRDAFPSADDQLVLRLASAITQRRRLLKYRENRSQKLKAVSATGIREEGESVTATTLRPPTDLPPNEIEPSEAGTISTTATSVQSEKVHLPRRPKSETGEIVEDFECPCCFRAVHVSARDRAWK